ncbi:helix-turn-helix domain-containing protein [Burkholderia guangdongensis]|uniref:helix-turn-helix domain-containing protein n=1 Tax=Burkholderia guangdongensis TaxID=1792500 RepID=UPI0015C85269|nr:helix-turn-helix domain-containing protein [Burkholderia guangdongensis]
MENTVVAGDREIQYEPLHAVEPFSRRRYRLAALLFDGFSLRQIERLSDAFRLANVRRRGAAACDVHYELVLLSEPGGPVRSSSGIPVLTQPLSEHDASSMDCVFTFGRSHSDGSESDDHQLRRWLRAAQSDAFDQGGARRCGVTSLPASYGDVEVRDAVSPYSTSMLFHASEAVASDRIRRAANWLRDNSANRVSIAAVAKFSAMSERNFLRRFKQEVGVRPSEFVLKVRLEEACQMLAKTDLPADKIARRTGFGRGDRMARLFRRHLSLSPIEYRTAERIRSRHLHVIPPEFWVRAGGC